MKINNHIQDKKHVLFDFDGVILDSMDVRDFGFREIFKEYSKEKVERLIKFHRLNGGLSRFVKVDHFYSNILKKELSKERKEELVKKFTEIMRSELTKEKYLIIDSVEFIKKNYKNYNMYIVSGSEGEELRYLCDNLKLSIYFKEILGSPTPKKDLVKKIIKENKCNLDETVLIGDSINDYDAAKVNDIFFYGYNNEELKEKSDVYIDKFNS